MSAGDIVPVVTIDGPSGTGKGSVSQMLAKHLGFALLDSGSLYRVVALEARSQGLELDDEAGLARTARQIEVCFEASAPGHPAGVIWRQRDVRDEISGEDIGALASRVAALPKVRDALLDCQRSFRKPPGLVAEGRDMGTVVFPDARVKIYLTASAEERAARRHKQLIAKGISVNLATLLADIRARDTRDCERATAPLRPAEGAIEVNTTGQDIDMVLERVLDIAASGGLRTE